MELQMDSATDLVSFFLLLIEIYPLPWREACLPSHRALPGRQGSGMDLRPRHSPTPDQKASDDQSG